MEFLVLTTSRFDFRDIVAALKQDPYNRNRRYLIKKLQGVQADDGHAPGTPPHSGNLSCCGSGSQKLEVNPTAYTSSATALAEYASFVNDVAPGITLASCVVSSAADVPIMRPPMLAAKLSPVPRRCVGYILGR